MDDDRTKGKAKDVVGSAKETIGKAAGNRETERSGKADQAERARFRTASGRPRTSCATRSEGLVC